MADGGSSAADWISSIFTAGAVGVSLWTTWLANRQRKQDLEGAETLRDQEEEARRQGIIHQISFKLSTLASEVVTTHRDLNPHELSPDALAKQTDPFEIIGTFSPNAGYEHTMVHRLAMNEENLLMLLTENDFLMDFSECLARHQSIRHGLIEYKTRRDVVTTMLPPPKFHQGQIVSYFPTMEERLNLAPYVIPLGTLIVSSRKLSVINMEMVAKLCADYRPMMMKYFPYLNIHSITMGGT